jgi:hypothetical protein
MEIVSGFIKDNKLSKLYVIEDEIETLKFYDINVLSNGELVIFKQSTFKFDHKKQNMSEIKTDEVIINTTCTRGKDECTSFGCSLSETERTNTNFNIYSNVKIFLTEYDREQYFIHMYLKNKCKGIFSTKRKVCTFDFLGIEHNEDPKDINISLYKFTALMNNGIFIVSFFAIKDFFET